MSRHVEALDQTDHFEIPSKTHRLLARTPGSHSWLALLARTPGSHSWLALLARTPGSHSWLALLARTPGSHSWLALLARTPSSQPRRVIRERSFRSPSLLSDWRSGQAV